MLTNSTLKILIAMTIAINVILMLISIIPDHDPVLYGNIAKHMILSHDWMNLFVKNVDWLDKPHFPFWITALSFKLWGVSSFSYMLPAFIFYLIGGYYTYRLAQHFFNKQVGLLAILLYVTSIHLMLSSIDVKAEAYLLGEITPACYCWLIYQENSKLKLKYLFLGALFTALAMMTKGIFVLVTIFGGSVALWLYNAIEARNQGAADKSLHRFTLLKPKWILALALSFLFIAPELIALYIQFDAHPEKMVFNHTNVSGIKWFFWDSQVGRFFNTGPITKHVDLSHYIFFVHTFLWSFLPWSIIFIATLIRIIKSLWAVNTKISLQKKRAYIYLSGAFFPTFFLFSVSSFQLDHYINIIIPFAAIMCAGWVYDVGYGQRNNPTVSWVFQTQVILALLLTLLVLVLDVALFDNLPVVMFVSILSVFALFIPLMDRSMVFKGIVYPTLAINVAFIFHTLVNRDIYLNYDAGYKIAQYLEHQPQLPIIEYNLSSRTLVFHAKDQLPVIEDLTQLRAQAKPYYLVIKRDDLATIKKYSGDYQIILQTTGIPFLTKPFKFIASSLSKKGIEPKLVHYLVLLARS